MIGDEGAKMISEGLKNNSVLTKLDLNGKLKGKGLNRKRKAKRTKWNEQEMKQEQKERKQ